MGGAAVLAAIIVLGATPARADDCSSGSDCRDAPKNVNVAVAVAGGAAALALGGVIVAGLGGPGTISGWFGGGGAEGDDAPPSFDDVAAAFEDTRRRFDELQNQLGDQVGRALQDYGKFMDGYNTRWNSAMQPMQDYARDFSAIRQPLLELWKARQSDNAYRGYARIIDDALPFIDALAGGFAEMQAAEKAAARDAMNYGRPPMAGEPPVEGGLAEHPPAEPPPEPRPPGPESPTPPLVDPKAPTGAVPAGQGVQAPARPNISRAEDILDAPSRAATAAEVNLQGAIRDMSELLGWTQNLDGTFSPNINLIGKPAGLFNKPWLVEAAYRNYENCLAAAEKAAATYGRDFWSEMDGPAQALLHEHLEHPWPREILYDTLGVEVPPKNWDLPTAGGPVPSGSVGPKLDALAQQGLDGSRWAGAISAIGRGMSDAQSRPDAPKLAGTAGPSELEQFGASLVNGDPLGIAKGVAKAFGQPIGSLTDAILTLRDDSRQKDFIADHKATLEDMTSQLARASTGIGKLADYLGDTPVPDASRAWQTMLEKQRLGDGLASAVDRALDDADDPEEAEQLEQLARDIDWWTKTVRDPQVNHELGDVRNLETGLSALSTAVTRQRGALAQGADQLHQLAMAASRGAATDGVASYVHTQPAVVPFVAGVQQLLLGAKGNVDAAVRAGR